MAAKGRGARVVNATVRVGGDDGAMTIVRWRLSWRRRHHVGAASVRRGKDRREGGRARRHVQGDCGKDDGGRDARVTREG
jgi:hypothetical protein